MNCKNSAQNALKVAIFRLKIEKFTCARRITNAVAHAAARDHVYKHWRCRLSNLW